jgi:hypothetical protein
MDRYIQAIVERKELTVPVNPFLNWKESCIKEFEHWVIIPNEFPYDAISTTNHMIATKRAVAFDWRLLTLEEEKEIDMLKETYLNEHYDVVWENLPKGQTVPAHFHLQLLVLMSEEVK